MRCLQDCCEQEIDTGHCREAVSDQTLATTSRLPDVEVQDEPPELAVNGLEAMTSLNIMTKLSGSDSNETDEELFKSHVSERIHVTDWEILRGITLRESLCRGGSLWRKNPEQLTASARAALFDKSRLVQELDIFISHTWASGGWPKALSLLMQSGCSVALFFWFLGIVLATVLCLADILPMTFEFDPGAEAFPNICPLGPWVMIFGSFGIILGLLLSPYCPRCKPSDMCFIDAACVHQTDPNLMKRGIHGIGGFLLVSKELRIIWSPVYLTRLWCVFEVATYKKLNPNGAVVLAPIFLETLVVLFYSSNFLGSAVYWFVRGGGSGSSLAIPGTALCCLPYLITIHRLRKNYVQKHRLFSQFENFDLDKVECSNESDRNFVYAAIGELYGSNEAFTNYVKGPLRDELLVPIANSVGPQKYAQIILSPILTLLTEYTLALWKGGAPSDVILLYAMCLVVVGVCVFNRTCIALAVLLCDHLAEPVYASSIVFDWLQTLLIFIIYWIHFALGSALCMYVFFANAWELVPGILLAYPLMYIMVHCLHRKLSTHRLKVTSRTTTS